MFLIINDLEENTIFDINNQLKVMSTFATSNDLLEGKIDFEKFKYIIDIRQEKNNSLLDIFKNNQNYKYQKYKDTINIYKNKSKDSEHYIQFDYKLIFITGIHYPEPQCSFYKESKENISKFIYQLFEKEISIKNATKQDIALQSGIILNSFVNIKSKKKYILVQSLEDIKDDGNEYVTLTELTAINRIQEEILKKIEEEG